MKRLTCLPGVAVLALAVSSGAAAADVAPADIIYVDERWIAAPLTDTPGDAAAGRKVFANRKLGNCLACHVNADLNDQPFHGEVGPVLDGVGARYTEQMLRGMVVDMKRALNPESLMPGFYSLDVGARTHDKFAGKTILTAQQVEDVVAYLKTLK